MAAQEANFDGIVGPTHNYSGLSFGNVASSASKANISNPKQAALQGLGKMKALLDLGLVQGVLPPQERPDVASLRRIGFRGSDHEIVIQAGKTDPAILAAASSASSMWAANAATVSPSADTADGKVHFTPANLSNKFHRSIEADTTSRALQAIFRDPARFAHHAPLPSNASFGDEGAANHTRLCAEYGGPGLEFFVYGRRAFYPEKAAPAPEPTKYPARQSLEASQAIARLHGLSPENALFAQQDPGAIDAGVFHNDVAGVGNKNALFYHEEAYADRKGVPAALRERFKRITKQDLILVEVPSDAISIERAVRSYLFNSQLISLPGSDKNEMMLIAPEECEQDSAVKSYLETVLLPDPRQPIRKVRYFNLKESMRNGGGPACLRLRVVLTPEEIRGCNPKALLNEALYAQLVSWVERHYRDRLLPSDLADPALLDESRSALDELTQLLGLGSIYPFQISRP
ncbi:MAG: N-succinylarginine dihydrolase [Oligoflexia bacterium]|nr:N-succinylarginine dihydrolase [Oligoflexia bacterium]